MGNQRLFCLQDRKESNQTGQLPSTVKFLNFETPENFVVIYLKPDLSVFCQKDANGNANSEDPDQTAPLGAV